MTKIYLSSTFERMKKLAKDKPISVVFGEVGHPTAFVEIIGVERADPALKAGEFGIRGHQDGEGRLDIHSFNLINTRDK